MSAWTAAVFMEAASAMHDPKKHSFLGKKIKRLTKFQCQLFILSFFFFFKVQHFFKLQKCSLKAKEFEWVFFVSLEFGF